MAPESLTDSLRETLALFDEFGTPRTTSEVADRLDLGRRSTYERLDRLVEHGDLETKKVGASARVWWRSPPDGATASGEASAGTGRSADGSTTAADDRSTLVEDLPVMVYRCRNEPGWPMEHVGGAAADVVGYDAATLESGAVVWGEDVVHPEDRDHVRETVQSGVDRDGRFTVQYRVRTADGDTRWVWERGRAADGESATVLEGVVTDITEQKATEEALREERERFRSLVGAVEEYAIFTLDADGTVQTWNEGAEQIKGYDREEIVGRHFSTFYTREAQADGAPERNLAAAAADGSVQDEGWRVRKDGSRFWGHVTITAIRDGDGDLRGYTKVTRDMTDRRERERAVREERNLLENVLETSPTGIGIFDADGQARRVNDRFAELMGLDGAYALGDRPLRDDAGEIVPYSERPAPRALATGERVVDRLRVGGPGDRTRWLSVNAEPLDDADGVVVTMSDVTPLKERTRRLERQREDLESELEEVFERVDDGFFALDEQFRFTYVNERAEELLEATEEALLGESVWDAFPEARETPAWEAFHEAIETNERTDFEVYYDPLEFRIEASVYPSESGLSVHFEDVTEREERKDRLERYGGILDAVGEPAYELDAEGRFTFVNDAFVEQSGYEESALLGEHVSIAMDDEAIARAESLMADLLDGDEEGTATLEFEVVTGDGERRPVENRFSLLTDDEGRVRGSAGLLWDVSDRKAREKELERYETIVESIDEGVYVVDEDLRFTWVNSAYAELTGYEPEELVGEHVLKVVDEETVETATEHESRLRAGEDGVGVVEADLHTADGGTVPAAGTFAMISDEDGVRRRVGVARDITERRAYEEALTALYDSARELFRAETRAAVSETVVETVTDVLDLPGVGTYLYDEGDEHLYPAATSVEAGFMPEGLPTVPPDDSSITGHVYSTGEARRFDDVTDSPYLNADVTEMRAGVFAPMGDHGVLIVGSRAVGEFDGRLQQLVELLAANAEAAFDRVERERELERYETVVESIEEGVYVVDDEWRFTWVNRTYAELLGYSREELLGEHASLVVDDDTLAAAREREAALEDGEPVPDVMETDLHTADGGSFPAAASFALLETRGGERRRVGVVRDVTERKARERELEEYETIVEAVNEGIYVVDADRNFTWVNESYAELLGYSREELIGEHASLVVDDDAIREAEAVADGRGPEHLPRMDVELVTSTGDRVAVDAASTVLPGGEESDWFRAGVVRDVTERKARERELEESERRYRTLVDHFPNGAVVLFDEDLRYLTVGGEIYDGLDFSADDLKGETLAERIPEELRDRLEPEYRAAFDGEESEFEVEFDGEVRQFRVLPVHDEDGEVFAGMAVTQDVTRQRERERELERQREQLAALDNVNDVVREITDAVVDQSTREEIEATVCERLAATDSYLFAWVGEEDVASEEVTLRTEAGVDGYLEDVTISTDPDDHSRGPTARALRTGEIRTTRDVHADPDYAPWLDHAEEYGFRSSAAIPIVHGETVYGVLNVYADRPDAFEGKERAVVGQLGEVVGHAIAAAERKRALMSDEVVELEFRMQDLFEALDVDGPGDGTVSLDRAVPVEDGEFLVYGTAADEAGVAAVEALVDGVAYWTDVAFRGGDANRDGDAVGHGDSSDVAGETGFELRVSEPPVLSRVASVGGAVEEALLEDGDFRLTLHLVPSADVRQVIETVEETYPAAEMVKRRQVERGDGTVASLERVVGEELTDRQRVALEAAYHGGFFEWPREVSGEDVADSLGVAPPTFHQHLRKAERKVLESVLSAPPTAT